MAVIIVVDHYYRSKKARPEARDGLKGKSHIVGSLARLDAQNLHDCLGDLRAALDMTGRPPAAPDRVSPVRLEVELLVECRNPINPASIPVRLLISIKISFGRYPYAL